MINKALIIQLIICLIVTVLSGYLFLFIAKKIKKGQPILEYVKSHEEKSGTPTMGGLFFIIPAVIIYFIFGGYSSLTIVIITVGLAFMAVGAIDDFIKLRYSHNEGLKPYQKIIFQTAISLFAGIYAYLNGITVFYIPFVNKTVDLGVFTVIIIAVIFIATTNSVNLTDGLDGLASIVSICYLSFISVIIYLEYTYNSNIYQNAYVLNEVIKLSLLLVFSLLGFMFFNVNKAKVFMGDTGSLSLGGFIGAISVFSSNSFFIPILGIMFVLSSISVIMQVFYYKRTKKRIFLMAPYHHHLQLKGKTETQICFYYFLITFSLGLLLISSFL